MSKYTELNELHTWQIDLRKCSVSNHYVKAKNCPLCTRGQHQNSLWKCKDFSLPESLLIITTIKEISRNTDNSELCFHQSNGHDKIRSQTLLSPAQVYCIVNSDNLKNWTERMRKYQYIFYFKINKPCWREYPCYLCAWCHPLMCTSTCS
jgi:hypothetical protein